MKQPKKLTRNQKEILVKKGMNPDDYMLHSEDEKEMILYNRKEKIKINLLYKASIG